MYDNYTLDELLEAMKELRIQLHRANHSEKTSRQFAALQAEINRR